MSLEDVILFNRENSIELIYFDQNLMEMAQSKGNPEIPEYKAILKKMLEAVQRNGIVQVMNTHQLDAIIAPSGAPAWKTGAYLVGSSSPAAIASYPNITLPMGFIDGLPVGISFFGKAWSEPLLLEIVSAYEAGTKLRKSPE